MNRRNFLGRAAAVACTVPLLRASVSANPVSTRVRDLVAQSNVIDMLGLFTLNWPLLNRWQTKPETFGDADFKKLRASGIDVFHPAVAFDGQTYEVTRSWFDKWNRLISQHPQYFVRVDGPKDLAAAKDQGKVGVILGMQDANHLRTVDDVDLFYGMGQRLTQVTYNAANLLGSGCKAEKDAGLTPFGGEVIAKMNAIGMAIDVSHCGERTTLDAIEASKKPVLITHSNCKALAAVDRCKTDEAIRATAKKGGVIGITSVRHFVRSKDPVTMEDALDHFDHAVKLVGIEHVGLGSDLDLDGRDRHNGPLSYDIAGLNRVDRVFELTGGLTRRGYTDAQISLILGGNFQRALGEIWS